MSTFPKRAGLVEGNQYVLMYLTFTEFFSNSPSGAIITFHDRKGSFDGVEPRRVARNEKQLHP